MADVEHVTIVTPDGVELATEIHHPAVDGPVPTLLQRTCYSKDVMRDMLGIPRIADHGYRVVFQDCRGSGASTGEPDHFAEPGDGRTTGDWIAEQPWFDGRLGAFGASYMGFTAYAFALTRPPYLSAMAIALAGAERRAAWYPGGSFALDIALPWSQVRVHGIEAMGEEWAAALDAGFDTLPLAKADEVAVGCRAPWYQAWLAHAEPGDPFWDPLDATAALRELGIPVLLVDGWYDYQLPNMLRDFRLLDRSPAPHRIVVGPWTHAGVDETLGDETLAWFDRHLKGDTSAGRSTPVRIFVMPEVGWRDLPGWPPRHEGQHWRLQPGGALDAAMPPDDPGTELVYDPADPTPAYGGASLRLDHAGPVDNRALEARDDVLTFTTQVLQEDLDAIGPVGAELFLSSSVEHFDVFVRVCDVEPDGRSVNVCDGIRRIRPTDIVRAADGTFPVTVNLWSTAYRFRTGHRVRLQVSGGAHPLYARNTCSGEPLATASTLVVAHHVVHHDPAHPSALVLPRPT